MAAPAGIWSLIRVSTFLAMARRTRIQRWRLAAAPIAVARESSGPARSPRQARKYLLEINGSVREGRLQLEWTFSESIHRRSTIEIVAAQFLTALRSLIVHCLSPEAGGYTPSDFSNAKLSQAALDKLVAKVKHRRVQ